MTISKIFRTGRVSRILALLPVLALLTAAGANAQSVNQNEKRWPSIRDFIWDHNPIIHDGASVIELEAPERAFDAAVVPISMKVLVPQTDERFIKSLFLIIDNNPSPLGAWFRFDDNKNVSTLSTRVRIDEYTYVRALVEMTDGEIYMTKRFVKASGGCSAPTAKNSDLAMAGLGRMKVKFPDRMVPGRPALAQILVKHPNNSGLQVDDITLLRVPPHYVQTMKVTYNGATVFDLVSDISLSSDPSIHFTFIPEEEGELEANVVDSKQMKFTQKWAINSAPSNEKSMASRTLPSTTAASDAKRTLAAP